MSELQHARIEMLAEAFDRSHRRARRALLERLADLPGLLLLARRGLQITARHVEADGVAVDVAERTVDRNVAPALPDRDHSATLWTYAQEGRLFLDLLARRAVSVSDLVTWRPAPRACNNVYEVLAGGGGEHVGIVFDWAGAR